MTNQPREIPLSQGKVALVDAADYDKVMAVSRRWHYSAAGGHARATIGRPKKTVYMHQVILGVAPGQEIDHANLIGTDNRRSNLRICDRSSNCANRRGWAKSRLKGAYRQEGQKSGRVWRSHIRVRGRMIRLGYFLTEEEAHAAYCEAARIYHGEFARAG